MTVETTPRARLRVATLSEARPRHCVRNLAAIQVGTKFGYSRHTALLLTRVAYAPAEWLSDVDTAMAASADLDRDMEWARALYTHVAERTGTDVDVSDLETAFGFEWKPLRVDAVRMTDPYSSRVLSDGITSSFAGLLSELDHVCSTLPGLNPGEATLDREVTHASNLLWHNVGRALCDPNCTQDQLGSVALSTYNEIIAGAHERARSRLMAQAEGVKALQRLCAAATEGRNLCEMLEMNMDHIGVVTNIPPPSLAHELTRMGVPLIALRDLLFPSHVAVPMSGAERLANVTWWAQTYAPMIDAAALVALPDLHLLLTQPATWRGWDGIGVWLTASEPVRIAQETGGMRAALACPNATHTYALQPYAVVATATSTSVALRVTRLARVVLDLVGSGALRPRRVKAECLLSLIQRFEVATSFERERALLRVAELAESGEASASSGAAVDDEAAAPHPPPHPQSAVSSMGAVRLMPSLLDAHRVPKSLLRDYVVVLILRDRLSACPADVAVAYLSVAAAVAQLTSLPPNLGEASTMIRDHSAGSLRQTVTHVMKKVEEKVREAGTTLEDLKYTKTPAWVPGCTGLALTAEGRRVLCEYLDTLVASMQPPGGPAFAKEWHCSRSAMSHARRKQVTHVVGLGPGGR